jgi:hypothetical protein
MSKENFSELLATSDEDARVAKISRDNVEEYIQKRLKDKLRIGSSIIDKKAGKRVYYIEDAAKIIEKRFHWLAARRFTIEKITDFYVVVDAKDAWGRSMGQFTIHLSDLNLSTWDFAVQVRSSVARVKAAKVAEAKRTQEQDLKKLRDRVKAAQRELELAEKAVEVRTAVSTK